MMKLGITGSTGLLGYHLRAFLHDHKDIELRLADRATFADEPALLKLVAGCDVIVHLAGMNRGDDAELAASNIGLAESLIHACEALAATPHVIFASSTHIGRDTAYGRSKKKAGELLRKWANHRGAVFTNLVLPNVYGEFGRPFYNSVVSTFCHQLARGEPPVIIHDGELELVHAQEVARIIYQAIVEHDNSERKVPGEIATVSELLERLTLLSSNYRAQMIPDLRDELDLRLFNTLRSYLFPDFYPVTVIQRSDERGSLFEAVRSLNGGQTFLSSTHPGITRGNHYHLRKVERFLVASGEAVIRLRKLFDSRIYEYKVSGSYPQFMDMPTFYTHNITNIGDAPLLTVFWAHEIFDPADADSYQEQV